MFDPKSHEIAAYFLNGEAEVTDDEVNKLAQHIQGEIEAWLASRDPALIAKLAARDSWWCGDCGEVVAGKFAPCPKCGPCKTPIGHCPF